MRLAFSITCPLRPRTSNHSFRATWIDPVHVAARRHFERPGTSTPERGPWPRSASVHPPMAGSLYRAAIVELEPYGMGRRVELS